MKKLTAGILASLIGLVSANSADAAVASKAYVDGAIESLDVQAIGGGTLTSFIKTVSEKDGKIEATTGDLKDVITGGDNVTVEIDKSTNKLIISGQNTTYKGVDDVNVGTDGKINTKYYGADNVDITTATQETAADENGGWYVLMRKKTGEDDNGKAIYSYQWENLDRSYDADNISVPHDAWETKKPGQDPEQDPEQEPEQQ